MEGLLSKWRNEEFKKRKKFAQKSAWFPKPTEFVGGFAKSAQFTKLNQKLKNVVKTSSLMGSQGGVGGHKEGVLDYWSYEWVT